MLASICSWELEDFVAACSAARMPLLTATNAFKYGEDARVLLSSVT